MSSRNERRTFADIVAEAAAEPPHVRVVRPGGHNDDGDFFDPAGNLLVRVREIASRTARELVRDGAQLAFEGCGCGGGVGGCPTTWIAPALAMAAAEAASPRPVKGFGSPTWIDHWTGDGGDVVYVHGDVEWKDALI